MGCDSRKRLRIEFGAEGLALGGQCLGLGAQSLDRDPGDDCRGKALIFLFELQQAAFAVGATPRAIAMTAAIVKIFAIVLRFI